MAHSFIAYIDESGDDGLTGRFRKAGAQGGSSNWLTIGAVVWRMSRDLDAVQWAKEIAAQMPKQRRNRTLHFADMDHPQRIMAINGICRRPMRLVTVIANKPVIPPGTYVQKNQLYHYMSRYLIERLSWLCRDTRPTVPEGDGRLKIIFARRGGMSTDDFKDYLRLLKAVDDPDIQIHWPVIDIEGIEAHDQPAKFGLQMADIAVSGLTWALEPDFYGNCEPRFARALKPIVYHRGANYLSYGAKLVPSYAKIPECDEVKAFAELYGK
ncbi:MAG: hypothetical protein A2885_13470 [Sphingopyxis sp. RIFCSPHIGHO2_01_FULL_65_24]|nr:MAG: hypothetical protein A2885_13470 [Sphingopyxis sp. RIFCSPHIGHO2_01_FULL_65_24]